MSLTLLKKIGQVVLTCAKVVVGIQASGLVPAGQAGLVQVVHRDLDAIAAAIAQAEVMGQVLGLSGADKLKASGPLVAQVVLTTSLVAGHEIENQALFTEGCLDVANGFAKVLNALKADKL